MGARGGAEARRDLLLDLAERLEVAPGPSFELEVEIAEAKGWPTVPNFTSSIDAALRLVPEGWYWRVGHSTLFAGWAHLNKLHPNHCNPEDEHSAQASTPALALCAAALRASASLREPSNA